MKKIIVISLSLCIALAGSPLFAKGGGKSQEASHSNAPSTGTQVKGKERAMEVGQGKKKGLYKEKKRKKAHHHHHDHKQK